MSEPLHITLTPALLAHLEQVGLVPGTGDIGLWLIERAETLAALLAPVEGVDVEEVLRLDREATPEPWSSDESDGCWRLHGTGIVPGCVQILKAPKRDTPFAEYWPSSADAALITTYRSMAPLLARALVQARARLAEVEQERDAAERDTAGIFEDIGHYHFSIPSPDALAEEAEAVAAVNAWAHDEDGTIEAPALAVQVRALIAAARESDAARAEVARLRRALVEPTEETGDPDSEQDEGVVS